MDGGVVGAPDARDNTNGSGMDLRRTAPTNDAGRILIEANRSWRPHCSIGLALGWPTFQTFQNACETRFRSQCIESGVHTEEIDRLGALVNRPLEPVESFSSHA